MKPKKPSWKASTSSAPLKRGGGERRRRGGGRNSKDVKVKSEKKPSSLTLGKRKGREGGKSGSSGAVVTLADLAQSVPRSISRASSSTSGGMESPSIRNGSMGHGDQTVWKGSMELELYDAATPSSGSRKSCYSQEEEEESSLSERESTVASYQNLFCIKFNSFDYFCSVSTNRLHICSIRTTANRHGTSFVHCHDNTSRKASHSDQELRRTQQ